MGWTTVHVLHDELVGGAAADLPDSWRELYRLAGVDREAWIVVALDVAGSYRSSRGALLAVPRPPEGLHVDWQERVRAGGGRVSVRRFPVPAGSEPRALAGGLALLTELKRWSVRLVLHPLGQADLEVLVDEGDAAPPA